MMEKILIVLLIAVLNVGAFWVTLMDVPRRIAVIFIVIEVVVVGVWKILDGAYFEVVRMSIFLLGIYLMGMGMYRFMYRPVAGQLDVNLPRVVGRILRFVAAPAYGVFITVIQGLIIYAAG